MSRNNIDPFSQRSSGVLLHPTSLAGPYGVGDLGPSAYEFVDFLEAAGQHWWQMLPVGPPGAGFSPYDSPSAFAGSPLLLSLERLCEDGLLKKAELKVPQKLTSARQSEYEAAARLKERKLRLAYERFVADASAAQVSEFDEFNARAAEWLEPYSWFTALKQHNEQQPWFQWDRDLRRFKSKTLKLAARELADEVRYCQFVQFQFETQWQALRNYCRGKGVKLLGDVPMFVAHDGADVWANQHLFFLDETGARTFMAGVPPDYFSEAGQLWGNPLYRWSVLKRTDYAWWVARFEHTLTRFDALRLDHFIAFHRYWEIQGDAVSAKQGRFVKVPGKHFFRRIKKQLGGLPFVAEDLGLVTPKVQELRDQFGLPGMRVLQFGFSKGAEMYQPHRYPPNSVVYTGTHDNDTLVGWLNATSSDKEVAKSMHEERERARQYTGASQAGHWDLIRIVLMSTANTAIFPLQDLLGLGSEARMNVPGTPWGNWRWRVRRGQLTARLAQTMKSACEIYERLPPAAAAASQAE